MITARVLATALLLFVITTVIICNVRAKALNLWVIVIVLFVFFASLATMVTCLLLAIWGIGL